ncbi:MAG: hypothetical protein JW982_07750 [Spirochaetes bacterium]|nr:hypothetical protein [Spirochaetota bacterium]
MVLSFKLKLKVKRNFVPVLINELYKAECEITDLSSGGEENGFVSYEINLNSSNDVKFLKTVSLLKSNTEKFQNISYENMLDHYISKGLIQISPVFPLLTDDDYSIRLLGIYNYIAMPDMVLSQKSATEKTAAMISSVRKNEKHHDLYHVGIAKQIDSIIMHHFTGINSFPLSVDFDLPDNFIKVLKSIENGFSAIRFHTVSDGNDPDFYTQIYDELTIPVLSRLYDEDPAVILASVLKILKANKMKFDDCNIGFIGLNSGIIRLTAIFKKLGALRVLGYDDDEKSMMYFEKNRGLATTRENILSNSDVVILVNECGIESVLSSVRPGLLIISMLSNSKLNNDVSELKSCRYFHKGEVFDHGILFPGLLQSMIDYNIICLSDEVLIEAASLISRYNFETEKSLETYKKVHQQIRLLFK